MSNHQFNSNPFLAGLDQIRSSWGWFVTVGIMLLVAGAICLLGSVAATFATVLVVGWLLLFGGVVALVHAFSVRSWSGFFLYFLTALFRGVTGYLLIRYPAIGAVSLTLLIASLFIVAGCFRGVGAAILQFPRWGWSLFSGIVSVVLGVLLLVQMPLSAMWFVGFAIGLDMFFDGGSLIAFGFAIHSLPKLAPQQIKAA